MQNRTRKFCIESLEARTLLTVSAGIVPQVSISDNTTQTTWIVNTNTDSTEWDPTDNIISLREAIRRASDGDTIIFDSDLSNQTITLDGFLIEFKKGITIDASSIENITINSNMKSPIFNIRHISKPIKLVNLSITGGWSGDWFGGGINAEYCTLTLVNCTLSNNLGNGIYVADSNVTLTNCTISGNTTGGINAEFSSSLTLTGCSILGNTASVGGGIYAHNGTLSLSNCVITNNTASGSGGGICIDPFCTSTLTNCTISENTTSSSGGGILAFGTLSLTNCTISKNTAYYDAGGILTDEASSLTMTNCTITENTTSSSSGGICVLGSLISTNCTISKNTAANFGGGISAGSSSTLILYNTIVAQNTAGKSGSDIYKYSPDSIINAYNTLSTFTDWSISKLCCIYDPVKPLFTSPETGGYTLAENSQAIDKGNNTYVETKTDLLGNPRIVNGIVDLGAHEYQSARPEPLTTPTILSGKNGYYVSYGANRHQIEWTPNENAAGYEITYTTDSKIWTTVTIAPTASSAIITGLIYGASVTYKLRAIAADSAVSSDWTSPITFGVCPMDINNDGDIANADRLLLAESWLTEEGDELFTPTADIDGNGEISSTDRSFLICNWLKESADDDLVYPKALAVPVADAIFTTPDIF